jgi:hypothetical protein
MRESSIPLFAASSLGADPIKIVRATRRDAEYRISAGFS